MKEALFIESDLKNPKPKIRNLFKQKKHEDNEDYFSNHLRSFSLSELVTLKLETFFEQQRKTQVRIDGLYDLIIEQVEKPLIELSLKKFDGNQLRAAKMLGLNRNTLKKRINFFKINIENIKKSKRKKNKFETQSIKTQ